MRIRYYVRQSEGGLGKSIKASLSPSTTIHVLVLSHKNQRSDPTKYSDSNIGDIYRNELLTLHIGYFGKYVAIKICCDRFCTFTNPISIWEELAFDAEVRFGPNLLGRSRIGRRQNCRASRAGIFGRGGGWETRGVLSLRCRSWTRGTCSRSASSCCHSRRPRWTAPWCPIQ